MHNASRRSRDKLCALLLAAAFGPAAAVDVDFKVTDQAKAPVANAVIWLAPVDASTAPGPRTAARRVDIEQIALQFEPYVTVVRTGTSVSFPNRDRVQHHVYSLSPAKKFEFPLHRPGKTEATVFEQPGIVAVGCNIHDWMSAYLVVVDTPWFALTSAAGGAKIPGLPAGRYRAEIWHPRLAKNEKRDLEVAAGAGQVAVELSLKPGFRERRPPPAAAGGYE